MQLKKHQTTCFYYVMWLEGFKFSNLEKLCWQASFYSGVWTIWTCRNELVFRNEVWEVEEISDLVKMRMTIWIKGKYNIREYSIEDFKWNLAGISFIVAVAL
ncbi:uncharacterized protein LOC131332424 [Rhododendron vialii]|uniref:uncharacterized protein LOC131332424 n=1 Tax=Rhododendron vialii TaxID=182163 RepID=UPI00265D6CD3|nr:uncharacterized protein LOC131332424 [Rhododendron vialii]